METIGYHVGGDFARGIGGLRLQRMRFINRRVTRSAVRLRGRGMDDASDAVFTRAFYDISRPSNVRADVALRCNVGVGNPD